VDDGGNSACSTRLDSRTALLNRSSSAVSRDRLIADNSHNYYYFASAAVAVYSSHMTASSSAS